MDPQERGGAGVHPLEMQDRLRLRNELDHGKRMIARTQGKSAAVRMCMEERILAQFQRLPGLPSSLIGLETLLGKDSEFGFEDYLDGRVLWFMFIL